MAYAEKRGKLWRARWLAPDGTVPSKPGFQTRKAAEDYGRDQEAAIRAGTYVDPRAGRITLTDWVNLWYPALDLELNTLSTYRYTIEVHILPAFGDRPLMSLTPEEIAIWEKQITARGYTRRTAGEARSTLATILGDAIPRYIQSNPAARRRGKGRKGQRRIEQAERAGKTWPTPFEVLLFAERCSVLSGSDTDFVMLIAIAYTGMRWSEALGVPPASVHGVSGAKRPRASCLGCRETPGEPHLDIGWKLYELRARFYRGRPKYGSIRAADLPPFLAELLAEHLAANPERECRCRNPEPPWCAGAEYLFLTPGRAHFRRGNYATRVVRPAADGWYPERGGRRSRPAAPVLVDASAEWPGCPVPPWPPAVPGEPYEMPAGRGIRRLAEGDGTGRCPACERAILLRTDGAIVSHNVKGRHCLGSGATPADPMPVASWVPLRPGLTPHGLRHGHQTWLDDLGIRYVLQSERMGHEVSGMRGVYTHVTPGMRAELKAQLQGLWEASLHDRRRLAPRSAVVVLDRLLSGYNNAHHPRSTV